MSFTQPVCAQCWTGLNPEHPLDFHRDQTGLGEPERCCHCRRRTVCGVYIRVDPKTVPYPSKEE